jgi:site-specific recombinase XerD
LVRALARQARGHRFESYIAHFSLIHYRQGLAYNYASPAAVRVKTLVNILATPIGLALDWHGSSLMATLQLRVESWRAIFRYQGQQHALTLGKLPEQQARLRLARIEEILLKIKQGWLEVPLGCPITEFIEHDGKPPQAKEATKTTTCGQLRERYTEVTSNGSIEANTLYTLKIHLKHIQDTLGASFLLSGLNHNHLQNHIDRRRKKVAGVTIKKEITTFGAAWAWAIRAKLVEGPYPSDGLRYPIDKEPLPYMTLAEINRRIKAGGDRIELYEALYLDAKQISEVLTFVKKQPMPNWVYPMFVMAAHTGARRAEMLRAEIGDIDLKNHVVTLREKKKTRGLQCPFGKRGISWVPRVGAAQNGSSMPSP